MNVLRRAALSGLCFAAVVAFTDHCLADPCGMVPPVYVQGPVPVERIGLQKTYVFYKDGVESFVIRPGYRGRVEDFGMLIPVPTPPALRKVPDTTFAQIAAAIDPPEVVVDLTPRHDFAMEAADISAGFGPDPDSATEAIKRQVTVLKQEAVGMYEVAVLEAGSADALNRWMTDHGYRYPEGMDDVCDDYVADGWCFVAVKSRVGTKQGVDPEPGQKSVHAALPPGAEFDGYVQGMGFRFRSDELVVPMRLSAFNEGDMHNVVYLLTDQPMKAEDLPAGHVVRQLEGEDLLAHLNEPLPLRIIGGSYDDIPDSRQLALKRERDPTPHNGVAKVLFAGDLESASSGRLTHHHEELEKDLLAIGEFLDLRGPELDSLHDATLTAERTEIASAAIRQIAGMTMTVIDGDFDREIVAADNIRFTSFKMNPDRNSSARYNARLFGPGSQTADGRLAESVSTVDPEHGLLILQPAATTRTRSDWLAIIGLVVTGLFLVVWLIKRRKTALLTVLLCGGLSVSGVAQDTKASGNDATTEPTLTAMAQNIVDELVAGQDREAALSQVRQLSDGELLELQKIVGESDDLRRRGWAIVCLSQHKSEKTTQFLTELGQDDRQQDLVRCWATAALIDQVHTLNELQPLAARSAALPALKRPLTMKIRQLMKSEEANVTDLLQLTLQDYSLQQVVAPFVLQSSAKKLAQLLVQSADQQVRQQAAAWLATKKQQGDSNVNNAVIGVLKFDSNATEVPWQGGPLFVPGINWQTDDSVRLISELTAWWVWCQAHELSEEVAKIRTNINSWQLMQAAGFQSVPDSLAQWLETWQKIIGDKQMQQLMKKTGYEFRPARLEKRTP